MNHLLKNNIYQLDVMYYDRSLSIKYFVLYCYVKKILNNPVILIYFDDFCNNNIIVSLQRFESFLLLPLCGIK